MLAVFIASVLLAAPSGFTENATLNARASWVAQKPVTVYCANSDADWQAFVVSSGDTAAATDAHGVTPVVGSNETYIDSEGCAMLFARMHGQRVSLPGLGSVLLVLAHESFHLRGESDEGQTECDAIRTLPAFLVTQWGFKKNSHAYLQVMAGAWNIHRRLPTPYRSVC
jgi:hypothetical protein